MTLTDEIEPFFNSFFFKFLMVNKSTNAKMSSIKSFELPPFFTILSETQDHGHLRHYFEQTPQAPGSVKTYFRCLR